MALLYNAHNSFLIISRCLDKVYSKYVTEHYFSSNPSSPTIQNDFTVTIIDTEYQVTTESGVFSQQHLDLGTSVLLTRVPFTPVPNEAIVLDLGCGWGAISLALAATYPNATTLAVDVNPRALALTAENLSRNGFTNFQVMPAEQALTSLMEQKKKISVIWSNPPIRIGKDALHELLTTWFALLTEEGCAYLVVQRNLGADSLIKWINSAGYTGEKYASAKGFRIIKVTR